MSSNIPKDESGQVGNIYAMTQALCHDAAHDGYDRRAIAEALMCGVRDMLTDDTEFLALFERFKMLHLRQPPSASSC
jgi:hypothetical protein